MSDVARGPAVVVGSAVVVGLTGNASEQLTPTLQLALRLAVERGAPLRLVRATRPQHEILEPGDTEEYGWRRAAEKIAEVVHAAVERAANGEVSVTSSTPDLSPAAALVEESQHAALVVVERSDRSAVRRLVSGSVSSLVAARAVCPVLMTRDDQSLRTEGAVVVGVPGSATSRESIDHAFAEASWRRAPLVALHAWDPTGLAITYGYVPVMPGETEAYEAEAEQILAEALAGRAERYPDVEVLRRAVRGPAIDALLHECETAQLLVTARHRRAQLSSLGLGIGPRELARRAPCPVLISPTDRGGRPAAR